MILKLDLLESSLFFCFLRYWSLNPGPSHRVTSPAFCYFGMEFCKFVQAWLKLASPCLSLSNSWDYRYVPSNLSEVCIVEDLTKFCDVLIISNIKTIEKDIMSVIKLEFVYLLFLTNFCCFYPNFFIKTLRLKKIKE